MVGMSQHGRCQWALKLVSLLCLQALLLVVSVLLPSGRMQTRVSAFQVSPLTLQKSTVGIYSQRQRQGQHYPLQLHVHKTGSNDAGDILLVSSFSQGVVTKPDVQQQLRQSLLQRVDDSNRLRLVYIPTAMYALRRESNNTPGKQRQRARADAKKRRDRLVQILSELLPNCQVLAVTLDFADGSIKHPGGSNDANDFPKVSVCPYSTCLPTCQCLKSKPVFPQLSQQPANLLTVFISLRGSSHLASFLCFPVWTVLSIRLGSELSVCRGRQHLLVARDY